MYSITIMTLCDPCIVSIVYGQILCLEMAQTVNKSFIETIFELSPFFFFYFTVLLHFHLYIHLVVLILVIEGPNCYKPSSTNYLHQMILKTILL